MEIAVFGLGKLGLPMAAVFADRGHDVLGVDTSAEAVSALNKGIVEIDEPGLDVLVSTNADRLSFSTSLDERFSSCEMSFIIVPTPSGPDNAFVNDYVVSALETIGDALRNGSSGHTVVIASTVMPGSTDSVLALALEQRLGEPLGERVSLCYSPEFIALGSVVRDLQHPDMILVGAANTESGKVLVDFYHSLCGPHVPFRIMSWASAELAKLAVNSFVTTKISFANQLTEICESLPSSDVDDVTGALGLDSRIGSKYLRGGPPFGGPCFPRDNRALASFAESVGASSDLARATDTINDSLPARIASVLERNVPHLRSVAVLGLAYKDGTPIVEESAGVRVIRELRRRGLEVTAHDPIADLDRAEAAKGVARAESVEDAVRGVDAVVVCSSIADYSTVASLVSSDTLIVDCWRSIERTPDANIVCLGRPSGDRDLAPVPLA